MGAPFAFQELDNRYSRLSTLRQATFDIIYYQSFTTFYYYYPEVVHTFKFTLSARDYAFILNLSPLIGSSFEVELRSRSHPEPVETMTEGDVILSPSVRV
jgi:hypothetical protein